MNGRWIKVVIFGLLIIMLTSIVTALLDPGLGRPEDSRRTRHLAGFSICYPLGWGGTAYGTPVPGENNSIRLAQERKTGRETTMGVMCTGLRAESHPNATEGTFQGQPAFYSSEKKTSIWIWRVQFQRGEFWYEISLNTPIPLEVEKSPYWPFIESFRLERQITPTTHSVSTTQISPATVPPH
jgi:hypothetical protein